MTDPVKDFQRLQKELQDEDRELAKKEGEYEQLLQQMSDEFGCGSLEELEKLLAREDREAKKQERQLKKQLAAFKKKYDL